jgi:hypothetical protein
MAHRDISLRRNDLSAFRAKQTSMVSGPDHSVLKMPKIDKKLTKSFV